MTRWLEFVRFFNGDLVLVNTANIVAVNPSPEGGARPGTLLTARGSNTQIHIQDDYEDVRARLVGPGV